MSESRISVVGGVYAERCISPDWNAVYGSAGRAATAISTLGLEVALHAYMSDETLAQMQAVSCLLQNFSLAPTRCASEVRFRYLHDLATPEIFGVPASPLPPISVSASRVMRFGMLESNAILDADWAVYDPQNQGSAEPFGMNGSRANHLALVLNLTEARKMSSLADGSAQDCAAAILKSQAAEVVVVKLGPQGALVAHGTDVHHVPAYRSESVWKIGSGDVFAATFAAQWMGKGWSPEAAADFASRATAIYCGHRGFPTEQEVEQAQLRPIAVARVPAGERKRKVYLAGPFFDLAQIWMVEQARLNLHEVGLDVFSPFHDIGLGSAHDVAARDLEALDTCDLVFAIADGADTGTVFEVGYAIAKKKPVIVFSQRESEESLKMLTGTGCAICNEYATAVYKTLWAAAEL